MCSAVDGSMSVIMTQSNFCNDKARCLIAARKVSRIRDMEETIRTLCETLRKVRSVPSHFRVFAIGENHFFRAIDGKYSWSEHFNEFGYADIRVFDRGLILAAFAKLELLVNETINLHIVNADSSKIDDLSFIVNKLPFQQRIRALKQFGLINSSLERKLKDLAASRNQLAHEWNENSAKYRDRFLQDDESFELFSANFKRAFESLVKLYQQVQVDVDYEGYLREIIRELEKYSDGEVQG